MKFGTKLKLIFSKKFRDNFSCVGCPLICGGYTKLKGDLLCDIMLDTYEQRMQRNKECLRKRKK